MKKILLAAWLALFAALAFAQTYTVQNLTVKGSAAIPTLAASAVQINGPLTGVALTGVSASVLNVAALRGVNHLYASNVNTAGYRTAGDGGSASYYIVSTTSGGFTDDGCYTIIATDGAVWGLNWQNAVNVKQCGAYGDDSHDDTAAFNAATSASATYATTLQRTIQVPDVPVAYLINGTVYVRKGQNLRGQGYSTLLDFVGTPSATTNIKLGENASGTDSGGAPVRISGFHTLGGGGAASAIYTRAAGFEIIDMFLTFPGTGITLDGAGDGLISNIQIDQSLSAINITNGSQNIQITNFDLYLANYGFSFGTGVHDIAVSNGIIEYSQYASMLFQGSNLHALNFANINFTMNAQYSTFTGFINWQANSSDALWVGSQFHNMAGPAIFHNAGVSNILHFVGDVFDGTPTTSGYTPSTTASVLSMPASGASTYIFESTEFRNLLGGTWSGTNYGALFTVATGMTKLQVVGGAITNTPVTRFLFNNTDTPHISIKATQGVGFYSSTASVQQIVLPYWGTSTVWHVITKGDTAASSGLNYSAAEEAYYAISYQFTTSGSTYLDKSLIWQTPNRTIPGLLTTVGGFGTAPGGATSQAGAVPNGTICVSVPTGAATTLFEFFAETGT